MSKIILALESGGEMGSVALSLPDGAIVHGTVASGQSHSSGLLPLAEGLLRDHGLDWPEVSAFVFGAGPGSFTGLRISCGLIQGLAFAHDRPALALSSFEAMAFAWWLTQRKPAQAVLKIAFDARLNEAYQAVVRLAVQTEGQLTLTWPEMPQVVPLESVKASTDERIVLLRDPVAAAFEPGHLPLSVWLLRAAVYPGFVSADRWRTAAELQPLYVREKVAMTTEERHLQKDLVWQKYSERDLSSMMVIEHEAYPVPWTSGNFRDADRAGYEISLLKERGIMIGYVVWMKVLDEAHLLNFTLSPARQGQGLGTWMLSSLLSQIRLAGLRKILLEVRPSNQRAIMLYGKFGFQTIGRRKGYYPHAVVAGVLGSTRAEAVREDAIIMQKEV